MCEKQERINELEKALREQSEQHMKREADLFKTIAEAKNFQSQMIWRPWQVALIPILTAMVGIIIAVVK